MRIQRIGESYYTNTITDFKLYVRKDLTVVKATEWFYVFVGDNSYLPISSLILPEDGAILLEEAQNLLEPVEMLTTIADCRGGYRNIYLRMEESDQTEDGNPLLQIVFFDIRDMEDRKNSVETVLAKYRHIHTLNSEYINEYYFEYTIETNIFVLYKYVNERAITLDKCSLDEFAVKMHKKTNANEEQKEQMRIFCQYLKSGSASFEMEFLIRHGHGNSVCHVKGGSLYKDKSMVVGILVPDDVTEEEAYYLTPAARDAGTGLFNKKAMTEYIMANLESENGFSKWFMLIDIDDFKDVNDTFGHLFGDQVIRKVAEILQVNVGYRGVVGRFGGDEFFVFLEKVADRMSLKNLIKTVVKEMAYAFDPQLHVTTSIGVVQYPVDGTSYEELFAKADKALYIAKEKGKDRHIIYDEKQHGALQKDDMKTMTVAYTVSREKRREALVEILSNIYEQGVSYITENPKNQKLIRDMYDLDGITIYADCGKTVVCRNGDYACEAPDMSDYLKDEKFIALFKEEDVHIETNMHRMKSKYPKYLTELTAQEVGAFVQCLARKDGVPYGLIRFDVFNRNRKWSDTDIEMLSLIGSCVGKLLSK